MLPLHGITAVSLEQAVAAPFASRQFDTKALGMSSHFVWTNRGKESLTLNLKSEAGREILVRLLARADIFLQNLAPGAVERLGFGDKLLRASYSELIICHVSGYGRDGLYRDKKAYDLLIQAEAGLLSVTGKRGDPAKVGIAVADIAAGMYAYSGILAALPARGQTGQGTDVEVSMLEALGEWMGFPMYHALSGTAPPPFGAGHATIAPYGPFATGDGYVVMMGIQNERE